MHYLLVSLALIGFWISKAIALQVDVHVWPLSDTTSQLYTTVEYNSTTATILRSHEPKISQDEQIVRLGMHHPESNKWSGIITAADNFRAKKEKVILLNLGEDGKAYHIGLRATERSLLQKEPSQSDLLAEVVPLNPAPEVRLNKPVVLDATGQMEKPAEKTFLQKYWWAIAGFMLLQVFLGGGGGGSEKKE